MKLYAPLSTGQLKPVFKSVRVMNLGLGYCLPSSVLGKDGYYVVVDIKMTGTPGGVMAEVRARIRTPHVGNGHEFCFLAPDDAYIAVIKRDSEGRLVNDQI